MNECKNCGRSCSGSLCEDCRRDARLDQEVEPVQELDDSDPMDEYEYDDYDDSDPADDEYTWSDE